MSNNFRLVVRSGPAAGQVFDLNEPVIRIGRDAANDVVINDAEVSRYHARLTQQDSGYAIEDLNNTPGTQVNQAPVLGHVALTPGDTIVLGKATTVSYEPAAEQPLRLL